MLPAKEVFRSPIKNIKSLASFSRQTGGRIMWGTEMGGMKNSLLHVSIERWSTEPWPGLSSYNSSSLVVQMEEGVISAKHWPCASVSPADSRGNPVQALHAVLWEVKVKWLCAGGLSVITSTFIFVWRPRPAVEVWSCRRILTLVYNPWTVMHRP